MNDNSNEIAAARFLSFYRWKILQETQELTMEPITDGLEANKSEHFTFIKKITIRCLTPGNGVFDNTLWFDSVR